MWHWIELLSFDISLTELAQLRADVASGTLHPRDIKLRLARELATRFHDPVAAAQAFAGRPAVLQGAADGQPALLPIHSPTVPADGLRFGPYIGSASA